MPTKSKNGPLGHCWWLWAVVLHTVVVQAVTVSRCILTSGGLLRCGERAPFLMLGASPGAFKGTTKYVYGALCKECHRGIDGSLGRIHSLLQLSVRSHHD